MRNFALHEIKLLTSSKVNELTTFVNLFAVFCWHLGRLNRNVDNNSMISLRKFQAVNLKTSPINIFLFVDNTMKNHKDLLILFSLGAF